MKTLALWALRDVLRRPREALLAGLALFALASVLGTSLLLVEASGRTARRLVEAGPSLVIRRLNAGGWAPLPEASALAAVRSVRGVSNARTRVWGTVGSEALGTVTVIGLDAATAEALGVPLPAQDGAHVGPGLPTLAGAQISLHQIDGFPAAPLTVDRVLPASAGAAVHRAVLVRRSTARTLLKLADGVASDLVLDVFHDSEQTAILPDVLDALPWPARAVTRTEAIGQYAARAARRGSLVAVSAVPALLAIVALVLGVARDRTGRRAEVGLLKAMGWTTGDVVRLHALRAAWIGLPAVVVGLGLAYALVRWPGVTWPGALLLGWADGAPPLLLDADGALLVLAEVGALVATPWLLASLWPAFRAATADPGALLAEEGRG